jgi:hypothetical protein
MLRHCDGTDPNLQKRMVSDNDESIEYVPCDCGLTFDDVNHLVIYPHEKF